MKKLFALTTLSFLCSVAMSQDLAFAKEQRFGIKMTPVLYLQNVDAVEDTQPQLTKKALESGFLLDCVIGDDRMAANQLTLPAGTNPQGYVTALAFGPRKEGGKPSDHNLESWPSLFFKTDLRFSSKGETRFTWLRAGTPVSVICFHSRED